MDTWYKFYAETFNFKEIRFFDIEGKMTGLFSRALTSPCGKIRIPINESADENSQIEEYLKQYKGEGIQHIAVGSNDLYASTDAIAERGLQFMPGPPDTYYAQSTERVTDHEEPLERMKKHGILIDGEGVVDGGTTRILLQIFSKTVIFKEHSRVLFFLLCHTEFKEPRTHPHFIINQHVVVTILNTQYSCIGYGHKLCSGGSNPGVALYPIQIPT